MSREIKKESDRDREREKRASHFHPSPPPMTILMSQMDGPFVCGCMWREEGGSKGSPGGNYDVISTTTPTCKMPQDKARMRAKERMGRLRGELVSSGLHCQEDVRVCV